MQVTPKEIFEKYIIKDESIKTVADFIKKYQKHERLYAQGKEYGDTVIKSSEGLLETEGITWISKYESITGECIAWRPQKSI